MTNSDERTAALLADHTLEQSRIPSETREERAIATPEPVAVAAAQHQQRQCFGFAFAAAAFNVQQGVAGGQGSEGAAGDSWRRGNLQ